MTKSLVCTVEEATTEIEKRIEYFLQNLNRKITKEKCLQWQRRAKKVQLCALAECTDDSFGSFSYWAQLTIDAEAYIWMSTKVTVSRHVEELRFLLTLAPGTKLNPWMYERDVIDKMNDIHKLRAHALSLSLSGSRPNAARTPTHDPFAATLFRK